MQLSILNQWFNNDVMKALSWTFVHSLWQGLLAALLAAVIISTTRKATARLRYNLLGIVLLLFIATAVITFSRESGHKTAAASAASSSATTFRTEFSVPIIDNTAATAPAGFINDLSGWFNTHTDLFILTWALFFLINCLKLFTGLASIHRLRHYKTHPACEEWKIKLEQLRHMLGIRQSVSLLQSELIKVPVALGFLKPVILLPIGLLAHIPPEQVETILLHELSHIRRRDYLLNFLQHFAEAIFFFNPAMLWISSLLRQEREACCDDVVVANTGQKSNYLNALVAFQEYSFNHPAYVMAISSRSYYLLNRVKRMITNENKKLNLLEKATLLSGVLLFSAFTFITQDKKVNEASAAFAEKLPILQQASGPVHQDIIVKSAAESIKKEKKKIAGLYKMVTDTFPDKKDNVSPVIRDINFKNITTTMQINDGIKKQTIEATADDGTKYIIKREDGKVTSLVAGNKNIPDEEIGNWSAFLDNVEAAMNDAKEKQQTIERIREQNEAKRKETQQNIERTREQNEAKNKETQQNIERIREQNETKRRETQQNIELIREQNEVKKKETQQNIQLTREQNEAKRKETEIKNGQIKIQEERNTIEEEQLKKQIQKKREEIEDLRKQLQRKKSENKTIFKKTAPDSEKPETGPRPKKISTLFELNKTSALFTKKETNSSFTLKKNTLLNDGKIQFTRDDYKLHSPLPHKPPSAPGQLKVPLPPPDKN